jgi:hypothetical protein
VESLKTAQAPPPSQIPHETKPMAPKSFLVPEFFQDDFYKDFLQHFELARRNRQCDLDPRIWIHTDEGKATAIELIAHIFTARNRAHLENCLAFYEKHQQERINSIPFNEDLYRELVRRFEMMCNISRKNLQLEAWISSQEGTLNALDIVSHRMYVADN